jgi:hypothetical protein
MHAAFQFGATRTQAPAAHAQAERDVLEHGEVIEKRVVLEHETDAALARADRGHVAALEAYRAAIRELEAGGHAQQCGLAATGRSEQGEQPAGFDREVDAVERERAR